jgi:hypothetical protein
MRRLFAGGAFTIVMLASACLVVGGTVLAVAILWPGGGDSSGSATPSTGPGGVATLSGLQGQLAAVVLQPGDVPDGLDGTSPTFSTNVDVAGSNQAALQKLVEQGRQLGVDVQFIPTERLDPNSPLRGGIQTSASVYTNTLGASQSFQDTAAQARANNWQANYPDILNMQVTEVQRPIGDEFIWLRLAGKDCLPTPSPGATAQACNGPQHQVIVDNLVFRVGRVRAYLQVSTLFPAETATADVYEDQISQWAQSVVQHARDTFPTA